MPFKSAHWTFLIEVLIMLELILIVLSLISTALTGTLWLKYDGPIYILYYVLFILAFYVIYFLIFAILFAILGKTVNLNK